MKVFDMVLGGIVGCIYRTNKVRIIRIMLICTRRKNTGMKEYI